MAIPDNVANTRKQKQKLKQNLMYTRLLMQTLTWFHNIKKWVVSIKEQKVKQKVVL